MSLLRLVGVKEEDAKRLLSHLKGKREEVKGRREEVKKTASREDIEAGTIRAYEESLRWYAKANPDSEGNYIKEIQQLSEFTHVPVPPEILLNTSSRLLEEAYYSEGYRKSKKLRASFNFTFPPEIVQQHYKSKLTNGDVSCHLDERAEQFFQDVKESTGHEISEETLQELANEEISYGQYRRTSILEGLGKRGVIKQVEPVYQPESVQKGYLYRFTNRNIKNVDIKAITHFDVEPATIFKAFDELARMGGTTNIITINEISKHYHVEISPGIREKMNASLAKG